MNTEQFIQNQLEQTRQIINRVEQLKSLDIKTLTWKEHEESWSILECIEHLNLYGAYYLPQIEKGIRSSKTTSNPRFKSGILGAYFSKSMLPKEKLNAMKTFKDKNPLNASLDKDVLDIFIAQQMQTLNLLNASRKIDLNQVKIPTSISKLIKIKLGDTFQFIINHILRHLKQVERIQSAMKANDFKQFNRAL